MESSVSGSKIKRSLSRVENGPRNFAALLSKKHSTKAKGRAVSDSVDKLHSIPPKLRDAPPVTQPSAKRSRYDAGVAAAAGSTEPIRSPSTTVGVVDYHNNYPPPVPSRETLNHSRGLGPNISRDNNLWGWEDGQSGPVLRSSDRSKTTGFSDPTGLFEKTPIETTDGSSRAYISPAYALDTAASVSLLGPKAFRAIANGHPLANSTSAVLSHVQPEISKPTMTSKISKTALLQSGFISRSAASTRAFKSSRVKHTIQTGSNAKARHKKINYTLSEDLSGDQEKKKKFAILARHEPLSLKVKNRIDSHQQHKSTTSQQQEAQDANEDSDSMDSELLDDWPMDTLVDLRYLERELHNRGKLAAQPVQRRQQRTDNSMNRQRSMRDREGIPTLSDRGRQDESHESMDDDTFLLSLDPALREALMRESLAHDQWSPDNIIKAWPLK